MPVRKGLATVEQESEIINLTTSTTMHAPGKRKQDQIDGTQASDIRQDWASFIRSSTIQSSQKKPRRSSVTPQGSSDSSTASTAGASQEYMFKLPDLSGIDLKSVDVVLISNFNHMLSLPYLTEFTDFQGRIFATEPTIEFGRYVRSVQMQPFPLARRSKDVHCLTPLFRQHMIEFVSFFGTSVSSSPHHSIDRKQLVARYIKKHTLDQVVWMSRHLQVMLILIVGQDQGCIPRTLWRISKHALTRSNRCVSGSTW